MWYYELLHFLSQNKWMIVTKYNGQYMTDLIPTSRPVCWPDVRRHFKNGVTYHSPEILCSISKACWEKHLLESAGMSPGKSVKVFKSGFVNAE